MRVVEVTAYGGPEVLRMARRPEPEAGAEPGKVRVRLKAAGVNQADLRIRAGRYADSVGPLKPPFVLGTDFAGKLLDAAPGMPVGTRVGGFVPWFEMLTGDGTYAETIWADPEWLAVIPDEVDFTVAASLPLASATAQQGLDRLALPAGATVLVTGASAVVGRLAVQYASAAGLRVVAVAHEGDEPELRVLGADHVVPRGVPADVVAKVLAGDPDGVDGVFDGGIFGEALLPVVKDGGAFAAIAPDRVPAAERGIRVETVRAVPDAARLAESLRKVAARELVTRVADVMPLEEVAEAHRRAEAGHRPGRIVLMI
ncbi:NADP-dependent oxidoreductase [Streptomyces tanashiensis]|uniref:NADP-dependent oxidoreductase n=1 Tax=Streptomyces tanashiensis TaxID=67367 RepID=A0ABY6R2M1_9ACTN|nr:NADP-dependent oxidoreductase [Streptomyces tanashiensis]UZX23142.1 NADP-dependent oxidoreductase [Streptomyces tanashiensis]GGY30730.1 zinc-binding alcohol dehydrogenase [Streptomyces tanashiensis]